jgi:hypothetical protein
LAEVTSTCRQASIDATRCDKHPKIRFHATLGGQPQVELALL